MVAKFSIPMPYIRTNALLSCRAVPTRNPRQFRKMRITSDCNEFEQMPVMVIDGHEYSWEEFGQMLLSHEGWQFKL